MRLDIEQIKPLKGQFKCNLFENVNIGLPLALYYSIEIPLQTFNTGHDYVSQPVDTSFGIEWIRFVDKSDELQEKKWTNLVGKEFELSYDNETAEGSIYLGTEHCQFNSIINFLSLHDTTFDIELQMAIDFNIDTVNLDENGFVKIKTQVDFEGLVLYDNSFLPSFDNQHNPLDIIGNFIDLNVYQSTLTKYENTNVDWKQLKPKK
jgi:hypothetical protein